MQSLELRIPPLLLAPLFGVAMWGLSDVGPGLPLAGLVGRIAAIALATAGATFIILGILAFRRFRTTVDPMNPHKASSFVTHGVFRVTRNPMYLGMAMLLVAWAVFLAAPWPFAGPVCWVLYMNRFQVKAEERFLAGLFGEEYWSYKTRVRRWL